MKRLLAFILLFLTICVGKGYGETFWVGTVNTGGGAASNVLNFDWVSTGSGVATGVGPFGTPPAIGKQFDFLYQAYLIDLTDTGGQSVVPPGNNSTYEFTFVAKFPEIVAAFDPITNTVAFQTVAGGTFYIYADASPNANVTTGSGFDDGILVARGTIDPDQFSTFTALSTASGTGAYIVTGKVDWVDPAYFIPSAIAGIRIEGTINYPPLDSFTDTYFAGRAGEGNLTTYTVQGNDLRFKVDASSKFVTAPPPPGPCRVTAGGVKDGLTSPCTLTASGLPDPKTCAKSGFDTWGGQAGAQPGIDGNWTHHHVVSSKQSFLFHSNSLFFIGCSDPGCCAPACANATDHQIDFAGIGKFNNQKGYTPAFPSGDLCFEVHLEDIGEPGPGGRWPSATTPCTHCPGTPIAPGDCVNCTDYYEIKIYDTASHDVATGKCSGNLIYQNGTNSLNCTDAQDPQLVGYFTRAGNVQMHPENN